MHELAIAQNILKTVQNNIQGKPVKKVTKIYTSIGVLSGVEKDALQYAFQLIPKEQPFQKVKLIIQETPLTVYCIHCQEETIITNNFILKCSKCGQLSKQITKGKELNIDKIEYQ